MAEFNYSKYVADMAQRKGPLHEEAEQNPASNVFVNQLQSTDKLVYEDNINEYEVIYVVENGKCYRITDEGYKDEVSMDKCRMYAEAIEDTDVEATEDEFNSAEFDKEPSKKDIKAAEKEFSLEVPKADASGDSAFEKAKQIIKIKVGKILAQPKGQRSKSTDLVVLKQFIQKPEIKKAFKSRGLDVMDFVKDVIA
jgi:hypothetical protein